LETLSALERERIGQVAEQFNKEYALQEEVNREAKQQAGVASGIQAAGLGVQGAVALADPKMREALMSAGSKAYDFVSGVGKKPEFLYPDTEGGTSEWTGAGAYDTGVVSPSLYPDTVSEFTGRGVPGVSETASFFSEIPGGATGPFAAGVSTVGHLLAGKKPVEAVSHGVAAGAGAVAGQALIPIPGVGAVIGGAVGDILAKPLYSLGKSIFNTVGKVFGGGGCIIVTCCHGRYSPEVNYARAYRDAHMDVRQLRGYYMVAERMLTCMGRYEWVHRVVKRHLVDHITAYTECVVTGRDASPLSAVVTKGFLFVCRLVGMTKSSFTRDNGEVV
jgi:hypothetical protein